MWKGEQFSLSLTLKACNFSAPLQQGDLNWPVFSQEVVSSSERVMSSSEGLLAPTFISYLTAGEHHILILVRHNNVLGDDPYQEVGLCGRFKIVHICRLLQK